MRRLISSAVAMGTALGVASPAFANHVQRETVDVAVRAGGQFDPSIKGDRIAYTDTGAPSDGADIVVYSISAGADTHRIAGPAAGGMQTVEDVDGNFVVFRHANVGDTEGDIYVYNLATNSYTPITNDAVQQIDPAISGTKLVWQQFGVDGAGNETSTIYGANVDGTGVAAIAPGGFQTSPAIDGNTVVWRENASIVKVDITNPAAPVKTTIAAGTTPDVNGSRIVYASGGNIFLNDAGATLQLTNDGLTQRNPKVSAQMVAWENVVSATDVNVDAWDFRIGAIETVAGGAGLQELHDLDGTNLAYTERATDASGDIRLVREVVVEPTPPDDPCDEGANVTVLFEETFEREHGAPQWENEDFDSDGHDRATVCVTARNVSSGKMKLNGTQLLGPSDFHNQPVEEYMFDVDLADEENKVLVMLAGKPCDDDGHCGDDDDDEWEHGGHHGGHGHHHFVSPDGDDDHDGDDDDDDGEGDDDEEESDPDCATMTVRVVVPGASLTANSASAMEEMVGCSVASTSNSPFAFLALAALAFFRRRRV